MKVMNLDRFLYVGAKMFQVSFGDFNLKMRKVLRWKFLKIAKFL